MATHQETLNRQWLMLQWIPRYPQKVTARDLVMRLHAEGHEVTKRTVERDLAALSQVFPLTADERNRPFGWSWQKDAAQFSLPGMSPLQAMVLNLARTHLLPLLPAHLLHPLQPYLLQADATLRKTLGKRGVAEWTKRVASCSPRNRCCLLKSMKRRWPLCMKHCCNPGNSICVTAAAAPAE